MPSMLNPRRFVSQRLLRLGKESFWVAVGQGLSALGGLVGVRLLTERLAPTVYGELALALTLVMLSQRILMTPQANSFLRFFASAFETLQVPAFLRGVRFLLARSTLILVGVTALAGLALWLFGQTEWLGLLLTASIFALLTGYNGALNGIQNASRQRIVVAWHQGIGQWVRYLAAVLLIMWLGATSGAAMLGFALSALLLLFSQYLFFRHKILSRSRTHSPATPRSVANWIAKMSSYAWPFSVWGVFGWAKTASDRWSLQLLGETSDVGYYTVLYQLGFYPIMMFSNSLVQLISPVLFSRAGDGTDPMRLNRAHRLNALLLIGIVLLTVIATLMAYLLHDPIFSLLVGSEYQAISYLLPWMFLSGGLFAVNSIATLFFFSDANSQGLVKPKTVVAVLGTALNFLGAYWLGLRGVVLANIIFWLLDSIWILVLAKQLGIFRGASSSSE